MLQSTNTVGTQEDFNFYPELKQYVLPQQNLDASFSGKQAVMMQGDAPMMFDAEGSNDFFSSFLNSDFPIDISFPVQTVPEAVPIMKGYTVQRVQPQAPIMQVAQNQTPAPTYYKSKNPTKYTGKRKAAEAPAPAPAPQTEEPAARPEQDVKRQKRRVKNREAAQLFRQRQKQHIRDLEEEVRGINDKNSELNTQVEVLRAENTMVKEQLRYLRCFITEGLKFAFPESKFTEMDKMLAEFGKKE